MSFHVSKKDYDAFLTGGIQTSYGQPIWNNVKSFQHQCPNGLERVKGKVFGLVETTLESQSRLLRSIEWGMINFLLTESAVITGKYQTEVLTVRKKIEVW